MVINKADWNFIFDESISDREYEEQFRALAQKYYQKTMGEKTQKRKQLTVGEKIAEVDKDRWTYKDLYESRHWVIGLRDVHNCDEENERFQIFYVMLDRCGMVQDYSSFFCNGELALPEFTQFYKKLVRIQNQRLHEEKTNPTTIIKVIGYFIGMSLLIAAFIMCMPPEKRQFAVVSLICCSVLLSTFIMIVWFKDSIKDNEYE